ncbi:hypothetical protein PRB79_gp28 [Klebsiella phage VLCpiS13d]|uniref:hypothetical protein n=1 Tax=Klebsiella phage VLCpiS13d TaxID=2874888 RepID=UPI00233EF0D1|nr:hypothetical protein PRB79_gp28 [Klebsiella phage VLCpiS13d]UVX31692.1 hypothetical protein S13d_00028 [Klebsiella phage VLCpiS13d]
MTSREQFVEWCKGTNADMGVYKTGIHKGDLKNPVMRKMWLAWQASRAAIEVELPSKRLDISYDGSQHYDCDEVHESLKQAGLKVKE